jgi:hypothetical protein
MNYFIVMTKWTKLTDSSPGYMSGFMLSDILTHPSLEEALASHSILSKYFDKNIYQTWASITMTIASLLSTGLMGFASAKSSDGLVSYSVTLYESEEFYNSLREQNPYIFADLDRVRTEYSNLLEISAEIKEINTPLSPEDFIEIISNHTTFEKIETIFNSL